MIKLKVGAENESMRDKWVINKLQQIPAGLTILDAGAGEQKYKKYCKHLKYTSQDFCQYDGKGDGKGGQTGTWDVSQIDIVSDILNIPCPDCSYDIILCTEVFEHLPHPELAIKEFSRILKSGGKLILTAPFCSLTHFAPYHFSTGFNRYWYNEIFKEYGFKIVSMETNGNYFEYMAQEIRRTFYMAQKYSGIHRNILDLLVSKYLLFRLSCMSKKDKHSDEVLCYGYHVVGEKI